MNLTTFLIAFLIFLILIQSALMLVIGAVRARSGMQKEQKKNSPEQKGGGNSAHRSKKIQPAMDFE